MIERIQIDLRPEYTIRLEKPVYTLHIQVDAAGERHFFERKIFQAELMTEGFLDRLMRTATELLRERIKNYAASAEDA